ncbi:MAG TPA: hypothetical protein ENF49_00235 [Candidatus Altiarchaeales archaeon]|nr:hypothetical protein [Candidatus Altiarchaeales archaeon]HEX54546.1 hypothetical protein [Candidatus Altiarchaeales archaeon]
MGEVGILNISYPKPKYLLFFGVGFIIGFFYKEIPFSQEFINVLITFFSEKLNEVKTLPEKYNEWGMFVLILMLAFIFVTIRKALLVGWGLLSGLFLRTVLDMFGVQIPLWR